ncbi:MAG: hypothetical protein M3Q97_11305 [Bacteroidota bacterium]|nr:hypothetical protein [Bacteroidota bacterium]
MKKLFFLLCLGGLGFVSCTEPNDEFDSAHSYKPLLLHQDQLENSVTFSEKRSIARPGKIYFKDNFIYLGERYKGVHIIDNSDVRNPQQVGFINAPGCIDMAMKGNILYIDNAVDLVAIDLTDYRDPKVTERIAGVFPEHTPPDNPIIPHEFQKEQRPENTVIIEWVSTKKR